MKLAYRTEIDGLRAIAILMVVIYHAQIIIGGVSLFPGGYIGVDVFFVISGYLITSIILRELQNGTFSFVRFYEKRVRRILPALYAVILTSLPLAYLWMTPKALHEYSGSVLSALVSISNFWFWKEDGYSAEASAVKPFLHTWSLSIEEQFYIFFPLLLVFFYKYKKHYLLSLIVVLGLLSLQLADYMVVNFPDAAFYLLPMRAWELAGGALLAKFELGRDRTKYSVTSTVMPAIGLFMIFHAALFFDHTTKHPSFITLLPVVGAMIFIWYARAEELVTDVLRTKPFVAIGLISYSLYLWHWIIFSFLKIAGKTPNTEKKFGLILIAMILATLTYFLVERPFRFKLSRKMFWAIISAVTVVIVGLMGFIYTHQGDDFRLTSADAHYYKKEFSIVEFRRLESDTLGRNFKTQQKTTSCGMRDPEDACRFGNEKFVTLGDSFVGHYETALQRRLIPYHEGLISLSYEQCPFISPDLWFGSVAECPIINEKRAHLMETFKAPKIVIVAADESLFETPKKRTADPANDGRDNRTGGETVDPQKAYQSYKGRIASLLSQGHIVVMIFSVPKPDVDPMPIYFHTLLRHKVDQSTEVKPQYMGYDAYAQATKTDKALEIPDHPHLIKVYPKEVLCNNQGHQCLLITAQGSVYNNTGHLSIVGADLVIQHALSQLTTRGLLPQSPAKGALDENLSRS